LAVAAALDKKNLKDDVGFLESQNEDEDLFNAINA
jgi:hypothetical protein